MQGNSRSAHVPRTDGSVGYDPPANHIQPGSLDGGFHDRPGSDWAASSSMGKKDHRQSEIIIA